MANPFCSTPSGEPFYALVIDAASSASRVRVYTWEGDDPGGPISEILLPEEDEWDFETERLSAYAPGGGAGAGASLAPILDVAKTLVPEDAWARTPLYVLATGGMRQVRPSSAQVAVVDNVREYLSDADNNPFLLEAVHIISGEEEALYSYISINSDNENPDEWMGVMDMGGASTQFTFSPKVILANSQSLVWDGERHRVFSQSYPRFGQDSARERYLNDKVQSGQTDESGAYVAECFRPGYLEAFNASNGQEVMIRGSGDGPACASAVENLLFLDEFCPLPPCSIRGQYTPDVNPDLNYVGISAFYWVVSWLGVVEGDAGNVTRLQLHDAAMDFCAEPLPDDAAIYDKVHCFNANYHSHVLASYGFGEDDEILMAKRINGRSADWTLGSLLMERELAILSCTSKDAGGGVQNTGFISAGTSLPWVLLSLMVLLRPW